MNNDSAKNDYEEGRFYQAKIVDQTVAQNTNQETQILLRVSVLGKLKNDKDPGEGTDPCPQHEREVRITLPESDPNRLGMAVRDLERLGFADDDVSRLHPDHPTWFSFIDREVHVRYKTVGEFEYWNLAWPQGRPKPVSMEKLAQSAAGLQEKIASARMKLREKRSPSTKGSGASNNHHHAGAE